MAVASSLRRFAWPLAAGVALLFLVGLALHGGRPDVMVQFTPAGVMTTMAPEEVSDIEIAVKGGTRHFRRLDGKWDTAPDIARQIEIALRLLRNSKPLRVMTANEVAELRAEDFALVPGSLTVRLRASGGASFEIQFGGQNPMGAARYVRVAGLPGMPLLPIHVADAWEQLAAGGQ
jgi:hypothetical protein